MAEEYFWLWLGAGLSVGAVLALEWSLLVLAGIVLVFSGVLAASQGDADA